MTYEQLEARVEWWRARLCPEYRIALMHDAPEDFDPEESWAIVQTKEQQEEAIIYFAPKVLDMLPKFRDRTIVHELLHVVVNRAVTAATPLMHHVAPGVWEMYRSAQGNSEEAMVERMTWAIVGILYDDTPRFFTDQGNDWPSEEFGT